MALGQHWQDMLRQGYSIKTHLLDGALKYCTRGLLEHEDKVKGRMNAEYIKSRLQRWLTDVLWQL